MIIFDKFRRYHPRGNNENGSGLCVWQQAPARRMVKVGKQNYFLSLPYVLFRISYTMVKGRNGQAYYKADHFQVAFAACKKMTKRTAVYFPPLPNMTAELSVCMPSIKQQHTLEDLCKGAVATFLGSRFNNDQPQLHMFYHDSGMLLGDYAKWEAHTKRFPNWKPRKQQLQRAKDYRSFIDDNGNYDEDEDDYFYDEDYYGQL